MRKFDSIKYTQCWKSTGIKDFTGCKYLLTRHERLEIVKIKMNRMYRWMLISLINQLTREVI